ncbi:hypothetical protein PATA110615_19855 [Paenibacillus taichungensis]
MHPLPDKYNPLCILMNASRYKGGVLFSNLKTYGYLDGQMPKTMIFRLYRATAQSAYPQGT